MKSEGQVDLEANKVKQVEDVVIDADVKSAGQVAKVAPDVETKSTGVVIDAEVKPEVAIEANAEPVV